MAFSGALAALGTLNYNLTADGYEKRARLIVMLIAAFIVSILIGACFANMGNWIMRDMLALPLGERIQRAGVAWYPVLLGSMLSYTLMVWALKQDVRAVMNLAVPSYPIFHAFGRVGCAFAGCCYGAPAHFTFLGIHFDRVPTQIMEAAFELMLFFVLQFAVKKHRVAVYMSAYAGFRFIIEAFRGDSARGVLIKALPGSPAQQIAVLCVIATTTLMVTAKLKDRGYTP
jgi:phosphatidylglycerol:prolipoprotein diacylglycerol transferase